ncbi:MAG: aminopeptidase [Firmicutes bacterium]|nr:aminopeptidase [Bacillota bacterium]
MPCHDREEAGRDPCPEPDFRSIAEKIVRTCLRIRPGQVVQVGGGIHAFGFLSAVAAAVRRAGGFAELSVTSDDLQLETLETVPIEYLQQVPAYRLKWLEDVHAMIVTDWTEDPRRAERVCLNRRLAAQAAVEAVQRRLAESDVRWAYVGYPTRAAAEELGIPFCRWWTAFWRAVDADYEAMASRAAAVVRRLEESRTLRIVTPQGTDLTLTLAGRPVLADDGVISDDDAAEQDTAVTLPAGRVFTAPAEDSANGRLVVDSATWGGRRWRNVELVVSQGRIRVSGSDAEAREFGRVLDAGHGDKDRIGELGIGINPAVDRFTGSDTLDTRRAGAVYVGVGDNRLIGGANAATLSWQLCLERPTVLADGRPLLREGEFCL